MNWMVFIVQMTRLLAWPVAVTLILYWYRSHVTDFANFIRGRQFKISAPMFSFEAAGAVQEELRSIQREAPPTPAIEPSEVPDIVEARRFILRDEAGRQRAEIAMRNAVPFFRLIDSGGNSRVFVTAGDEEHGAAMAMNTAKTNAAIVLAVPQIMLIDAEGRPAFKAP
jgi:hypothetical protein